MRASSTIEAGLAPSGPIEASRATWREMAPGLIMIAAVLFNPMLAIVNANVRPLSSFHVIVTEILIVGATHALILSRFRREMRIWYAYLAFVVAFAALRIVATGIVEPRYLRDLLMIPTFVMLGMLISERALIKAVLGLLGVVMAGVLLEAFALSSFEALFNVKQYYINTRGMVSDEFTTEGSKLFVSATRPDARFFPFFDLHRLSSIFLEPVSLGNYAVIMVCFAAAFWPRLTVRQRAFVVAGIVLVLFACDGRLSSMAVIAVLGAALFAKILPRNIALTFLPVIMIVVIAVAAILDFKTGTDDFPGRLAHTRNWLADFWLTDYLGVSNRLLPEAEDSGIIYLIITQSILGTVVMWLMIVLGMDERTQTHQIYKNGICLYLVLTMIVSFSLVSIKTAALLWLIYGHLVIAGGGEDLDGVASGAGPVGRGAVSPR